MLVAILNFGTAIEITDLNKVIYLFVLIIISDINSHLQNICCHYIGQVFKSVFMFQCWILMFCKAYFCILIYVCLGFVTFLNWNVFRPKLEP